MSGRDVRSVPGYRRDLWHLHDRGYGRSRSPPFVQMGQYRPQHGCYKGVIGQLMRGTGLPYPPRRVPPCRQKAGGAVLALQEELAAKDLIALFIGGIHKFFPHREMWGNGPLPEQRTCRSPPGPKSSLAMGASGNQSPLPDKLSRYPVRSP